MIIASSLFFIYVITILIFVYGFDRVNDFKSKKLNSKTSISVIIPFRNEAKNLPKLLESITELKYPKELFQFIFVDDNSSDTSIDIVNQFKNSNQYQLKTLQNDRNSSSPKKDAITTAINYVKTEWIITTDADCKLPKNWLKTIDNYIQQHNCNMLVAPVTYKVNKRFLEQFQLFDFLSLQASTISGFGLQKPFLCNGANLAYRKSIFKKVNGFKNNNSIASGDDIFLFEKFLQLDKKKVHYLKSKEAIVTTFPVNTFNDLLNQRVRWASKTSSYNLFFGKLIGLIILAGNSFIAATPFLLFFSNLEKITTFTYIFIKLFFDYLLIEKISNYFNQKIRFSAYLTSSILYPYFTIFVILKSLFSSYNWKNRTFRK